MYAGMKWAIIAAISTVSLAVTPNDSWAQRRGRGGRGGSGWSIGIGPGGIYGGYNQGGWRGNRGWYGNRGGWYGNGGYYGGYYPNYGYSNGYYVDPSYSSGGVIYSTPSYSSSPVATNNVTPNAPVMRSGSGGDVIIENSADNGTALNYSLNGHDYTIQPGQTQRITNDRNWIVEFDRGSGQGTGRYTLSEGRFKFKSTDSGWDLVRAASQSDSAPQTTAKPPLPDPTLQSAPNQLESPPVPK